MSPELRYRDGKRPLIYQVELSSFCNMRCGYCPHPTMRRAKGYMEAEVLNACIGAIKDSGGGEIVLHHFGEPLLHPSLGDRLRQAAAAGLAICMSTNALLIDRAWEDLTSVEAPVRLVVSVHQWAGQGADAYLDAVEAMRRRAAGTNLEVVQAYNCYGGTFTFHCWAKGLEDGWDVLDCPFIKYNYAVVLWNGDIAACCVDHEGATVTGNILDKAWLDHRTGEWSACATCDVGRDARMWPLLVVD
jgi:hypothetical protein